MPKKKPRKKSPEETKAEKSLELLAAVKEGRSFAEIRALVEVGGDVNIQHRFPQGLNRQETP